jgi:hypothetical protein
VESSLHRQLKERYGEGVGGRTEVGVDGFRVDAIDPEGRLVEIQAGRLGALKEKLSQLLGAYPILVVKPIVLTRRIVRRASADGPDLSSRRSPRRGDLLDVFDDLVGLAKLFPHPNLTIEVAGVAIEEIRVPGGRRGHTVIDRRLVEVVTSATLKEAVDLWSLLPVCLDPSFTTADCARRLGRSVAFAQRMAYCLRHAGAIEERGFRARRRIFARPTVGSSLE